MENPSNNTPLQNMIDSLLPKPKNIHLDVPMDINNWWAPQNWRKDLVFRTNSVEISEYWDYISSQLDSYGFEHIGTNPSQDSGIEYGQNTNYLLLTKKDLTLPDLNLKINTKSVRAQDIYRDYLKEIPEKKKLIEQEGYYLWVDHQGLVIISLTPHGCFNGLQTFLQMATWAQLNAGAHEFVSIELSDFPSMEIRAFHLDLKNIMPTDDYIESLIKDLAKTKQNFLCIEYEDKFPYKNDLAPIKHNLAWDEPTLNKILALCRTHFIEVIPLIQVFGHTETFIRKPEFQHLQETPTGLPFENLDPLTTWSLCPLKPASIEFAHALVDQVCAAHPDSRYLHIGSDEVYQLGTCPDCQEYLKTHSKSELYINYLNKVIERVVANGKIPIIWDDYIQKYPDFLTHLHPSTVLMYWMYSSWKKGALYHHQPDVSLPGIKEDDIMPYFSIYREMGFHTMGAPSISADFDMVIPNLQTRLENIAVTAYCTAQSNSLGILNTSWVVCANPLDTQYLGILVAGGLMWNTPEDYKKLSYSHFQQSIMTQVFKIANKSTLNSWLEDYCLGTERVLHLFPIKNNSSIIASTLKTLHTIKTLATENQFLLDASIFAFEYLQNMSELVSVYWDAVENVQHYAESDNDTEKFPTMDYLSDLLQTFSDSLVKFEAAKDSLSSMFIDNSRVKPGQFEMILSMPRYATPEWLLNIQKGLELMLSGLDQFFLNLFNHQIELDR